MTVDTFRTLSNGGKKIESNMNFVDAAGVLADSGEFAPCDDLSRIAREVVRKVVDAYDALEPKPEDWPKWATYCVIHANGLQYFVNGGEPMVTHGYNAWDFPPLSNRSDFYREVDLPVGLDWRECKWKNPNANN